MLKQYLIHISLMILMISLSLFMFFIFFYGLNLFQLILAIPLFLIIFRKWYQTILIGILSNILFIFSEKEINIKYQGYYPSKYMIVNGFKYPPKYKPFFLYE